VIPMSMRALGFCVSIAHAEFMARKFSAAGLPSLAISADTETDDRVQALADLRAGRVRALFAVDLLNEGVDLPEIDTILFLRPTESALVFLQQLGRGLRLAENKDCVTVLDFIGEASRHFRFDLRYRAVTGATRAEVTKQIEQGFPFLPAGCSMRLDRVATEIVLRNIRTAIPYRRPAMERELWSLLASEQFRGRVPSLKEFLSETGLNWAMSTNPAVGPLSNAQRAWPCLYPVLTKNSREMPSSACFISTIRCEFARIRTPSRRHSSRWSMIRRDDCD
jgi:superfamily II DNA or RNA helicase